MTACRQAPTTNTHPELYHIDPSTDIRWAPSGLKAPGEVSRCKDCLLVSPTHLVVSVGVPTCHQMNSLEAVPVPTGKSRHRRWQEDRMQPDK